MRRIKLGTLFLISFLCLNFPQTISAQCMNYPVTLEDREMHADHIVLGRIVSQEAYWDREHQNIRTLNIVEVTAWLKGNTGQTEIGVITLGGVVGDRAQVSHPALQLKPWNEYVLFLQGDNFQVDHPSVRQNQPTLIQAEPYADAQGAFTKQSGAYHDLLSEPKHTEASLFNRIQALTGETAATPENRPFTPRHGDTFPLSAWAQHVAENSRGSAPITSFSPNPSHAGTTFASDVITINGSGFGATPGTVFYSNADDGGATFTSSGVATDNLSWNDSQIQNRPAGSAGTGPINVNGTMTSGSNLTINYALIDINSSFAAFANVTRQMPRLVDKNGSGGMTFTLNTAFAANSAANQAFNRALETWVCNTNVNFTVAGATTATSSVGSDGLNVVFFDGTLPAGVLGRANSLFQASATGACNQTNTVWWADEIDMQFRTDPPAGCCSWNFGPGASAFLEFDFETVALHELGHAHGLGHVIDPGAVMHFAVANGSDARFLSGNDIAGGLQKMILSTSPICFNPAGVNGPMTLLNPPACTLPVEWQAFTGVHVPNRGNVLDWSLASELDNFGFHIQRSLDGTNFEDIGFVPSRGNSNVEVDYQYVDATPVHHHEVFYRLEQHNLNGHESVSEIVHIGLNQQATFEVYPTVVRDFLHLRGQLAEGGAVNFRLFGTNGQLLEQREFVAETERFHEMMDLSHLPAGIYFYRVQAQAGEKQGKIVVTN